MMDFFMQIVRKENQLLAIPNDSLDETGDIV